VPTISAGGEGSSQVLLIRDVPGLFDRFLHLVKHYANLNKALGQFREEIEQDVFPIPEHAFTMSKEE